MCGIVGCVSHEPVAQALLEGLRKVEYRGYDSAGMATVKDGRLTIRKGAGRVADIEQAQDLSKMAGTTGMAHTRWATHGGVTDANAHPHASCDSLVAVIHNGIIENYLPLKLRLVASGHKFRSDTDTEVVAHLVEEEVKKGRAPLAAVSSATKKLKGQYALVVMFRDRPDVLVGSRKDAPLTVGVEKGKMFLASDVLAFVGHTDRSVFLDNLESVEVTADGYRIVGKDGKEVRRKPTQVAWEVSDISKAEFAHYTLKEIHEQPNAILAASVQDPQRLGEFAKLVKQAEPLFITASGTSFHAGLLMKHRLNTEAEVRCEAVVAGELAAHSAFLRKGAAVVVLSQSGETADVLEAVKTARERGAKVLSIVNSAGSTLARESDVVLLLNCGPEVGVAATKSFTAQVVVANLVVDAVMGKDGAAGARELSEAVKEALKTERAVKELAKRHRGKADFYFVARGYEGPVAMEGALKLKELSYVHAEGMPASELKHGTLALIQKGTPVVVINPSGKLHAESLSSAEELRARGAEVIGVSDMRDEVYSRFLKVPAVKPKDTPVVEAVPLQLLAYHMALAKRNDPDYPRNLAKSVTVK
jgi:glutamine---fructose-6-phosphate transaminase (isomerizing)